MCPRSTVHNQLLAALPFAVLKRLLPSLCRLALPLRQGLYQPDVPIEAVYFPETGMMFLVASMDDGMQAEVGVIGREGLLGLPPLHGVDASFVEAMVQRPGAALHMGARAFRHAFEANVSFRTLLPRYTESQQAQVVQTAACNGRHGLQQRLARWLLAAYDLMAMMRGVHRPSVTVAADVL